MQRTRHDSHVDPDEYRHVPFPLQMKREEEMLALPPHQGEEDGVSEGR